MKKKMMMTMVALLMLNVSVMAREDRWQDNDRKKPDTEQMVKIHTDRMAEKYGLNKKQAKKLLELNARYAGKMSPMEGCDRCFNKGKRPDDGSQPPLLRDSMPRPPRPDSEAMQAEHKEMQENMAAYRSELKEIMTEEQYAKYESDAKQIQHRHGRGTRFGKQIGTKPPKKTE